MNSLTPVREILHNYYLDNIRKARTDLSNPRSTWNWGYHDGAADKDAGKPHRVDILTHYDPYYAAGYLTAHQNTFTLSDSSIPWKLWVEEQTPDVYRVVAESILESLIIGAEHLFKKKQPRATFATHTKDRIISGFYNCLPAGNVRQAEIALEVVKHKLY